MVVDEHHATLHDGLRGRCSSTSVPPPRARHDRRAAAGALHPALDRLDQSPAVGRHVRAVEAGAAIADEHADRVVRDLRVDVDLLDAGELGCVRHRLACGEHERAHRRIDRAVTGARQLDAHAVELLDVACRRCERRRHRSAVVAERLVAVQPAAQLSLLPARQRRDAPGLVARAAGSAPASAAPSRARGQPCPSAPRCECGRCVPRRARAPVATPRGLRSGAARRRRRRARAASRTFPRPRGARTAPSAARARPP